jgi:hypothetical protein
VGHALVPVVADDLAQRCRRAQPRRRQLDLLEPDRLLGLGAKTEPRADLGRCGAQVGRRRLLVGVPPAPMLALALVRARWGPRPGLGYQ